jgi:hypothetical protein
LISIVSRRAAGIANTLRGEEVVVGFAFSADKSGRITLLAILSPTLARNTCIIGLRVIDIRIG